MKTASIITFVMCFACGASLIAARSFDEDNEWELLRDIASFSQSGDYERIYGVLGSDYRRRVTKEFFIRSSKESGWILLKPRMGTVQAGTQSSYAPIRAFTKTHAKTYEIDAVLFFIKEEGGWKIRNFPFLPEHMPNWPELPSWLE